jgi:hypothetical protein
MSLYCQNAETMSYTSFAELAPEVSSLALRPEAGPAHIGLDVAWLGRLAAVPGLQSVQFVGPNWPQTAEEIAFFRAATSVGQAGQARPAPHPSRFTPVEALLSEDEEDAAELARLAGGKLPDLPLAQAFVSPDASRSCHGHVSGVIQVDTNEIERRLVNAGGLPDVRSPENTELWAGFLNQAALTGLADAAKKHYFYHQPATELRYGKWLYVATVGAPAASAVEFGWQGALVGAAAAVLGHNALRAAIARREGVPLKELCWSVLPIAHLDRVLAPLGLLTKRRPLVKALA